MSDLPPPPPRIPGRRLLHSPGPTPLPDAVLHALAQQPMDLADTRLDDVIAECERGLRAVLGTQAAPVFMFSGNGHGGWEAALVNLVPPELSVLVPGTGHFSEHWALHAEALGIPVQRLAWQPGHAIDPAAVANALKADPRHQIAAVLMVHTETASGITSDVQAVARAMEATGHPALLVVDGVASIACAPFEMDAWGVDAALGASQKGLMCPPGLAFLALGPRGLQASNANPRPRHYWDVRRRQAEPSYLKFCGTPPENHLFALQAALRLLQQEGLPAVMARHQRLARATHCAVEGWAEAGAVGLFCTDPAIRSVSVTAVTVAPGHDADAVRRVAREAFQVALAGGLGLLAGQGFRIGHLGDLSEAGLLGCLGGVEATLIRLGIPCGQGAGRAAAWLAQHAAAGAAPVS